MRVWSSRFRRYRGTWLLTLLSEESPERARERNVSARSSVDFDNWCAFQGLNQVTILGRVGSDPSTKGSEDRPVVTFAVATNANIKAAGGDTRTITEWHRICCFQPNLRESASNYMQKGTRVLVTGRLSYGQIVDGNGSVHQTTSIIAGKICVVHQGMEFKAQNYFSR